MLKAPGIASALPCMGMLFDSFSMVVITLPFVAPLIEVLGFNFIWFGVVYVVLTEIEVITPPFGLNLFVPHSVVPQYDIMRTVWGKSCLFMIPLLLMVALLDSLSAKR